GSRHGSAWKSAALKLHHASKMFSRRNLAVRNQPQNVIVHNDGKYQQQEHHADRDEAFLHTHAQVAPDSSFDEKEQDMSSIERGNRKQVQNRQVDPDHGHQGEEFRGSLASGSSG